MATKKPQRDGFPVLITVLVILLILAIALFIYGSMTNGISQPQLPGKGVFALGTTSLHG